MYGTSISECPRFNPKAFEALRKKRRLSRQALGERINETRQTLYRWGTGERLPRARALRAVAHVLRVRPDELLHPVSGEPTLADLRMNRGLTVAELAVRCGINVSRLLHWEVAGRLGSPKERPLLLAAYLGICRDSIEEFQLTGRVPEAITFRMARVLHVRQEQIQAAFDRTAALFDAAKDEETGNDVHARRVLAHLAEMRCVS
jgi:transcriptional regulator with XRE-family HTH domain